MDWLYILMPIAGVKIFWPGLIVLGVGVGVIGGFFGMGGAWMVTPGLNILGFPMAFAIGTDIAHMAGKSLISTMRHGKFGNVDYKLGVIMIIGTVAGFEVGAQMIMWLERMGNVEKVVRYMYLVLLFLITWMVFADVAKRKRKEREALAAGGLQYTPGSLHIRHLLDVIINDIGLDVVRSKVVRPLKGLRIAPYLGCMVPRPDYEGRWSDHEYPDELDRLLKALGAEVIDFPLKTHCCGGHMTQIGPSTAFELIRRLLHGADQYKTDLMVTVCPMCQMNLDAYQGETNQHFHTNYHIPIVFFTQVMGLAFGLDPARLGFGLEMVDARPALARIGVEAPAPERAPAAGPRRKSEGLPMPRARQPGAGKED